MVKWLAWGQKTKSSYTTQAEQLLGYDILEIVERDTGVVAFDTRVVANTEDCHGGNKNSPTGFNANQPNQLLATALNEAEVGYEMVDTGLDMTTGVVVHNSGVVTKPKDSLGCNKNVGHLGFECTSGHYGSGPIQAPLFTTAMSLQKCKFCSFQTQSCKASRARRRLEEHVKKTHPVED